MAQERERDQELNPTEFYMPYEPPAGEAPHRTDADIRRDVEKGLFYDDIVRSYEVQVDVHDGNVTLSGTVASDAERFEAEKVAGTVPGTRSVTNNIQVKH